MHYFFKVVETHSFTKAAEECFISQSAISQQIRLLESELGVKLLKREKRSFTLTLAGEYFYQNCQKILADVELLCKNTRDIEDDSNILKIGYLRSYSGKELQETIKEFTSLYPGVNIDITRGNHEELYNLLTSDEVSLVISDQRRSFHEDYVNYQLLHMDCFVALSKDNPLAQKEIIDVEELKMMTCFLAASKEQQAIEQEFYENIIGLKCSYKFVSDIEDARLMVSINRGFMVVDDSFQSNDPNIVTIPLTRNGKHIVRNYCAFWKKENSTYYIEEFAECYRKKIRKNNNE